MSNTAEIQDLVVTALREGKLVDTDEGTTAIGADRDVADYDVRAIVEELADLVAETPDVTRAGELAYGVVWQVIDRHYLGGTDSVTTSLHGLGSYCGAATVQDLVGDYLGEFAGDYDVDRLVDAFRDEVNAVLAGTGVSLHGEDFYSTYPVADDVDAMIRAALGAVDLDALAARFDTTGGTSPASDAVVG